MKKQMGHGSLFAHFAAEVKLSPVPEAGIPANRESVSDMLMGKPSPVRVNVFGNLIS